MPTQVEIDALKAAALSNAMSGITSASVDGRSSQAIDPIKQLDFLERLEERTSADVPNPFPSRTYRARFGAPGT